MQEHVAGRGREKTSGVGTTHHPGRNDLFIEKDEACIMNRKKKEGNVYVLDLFVRVPSSVATPIHGGRRNQSSRRWKRAKKASQRPPVGESHSNGIIERAVGLVAGQARTLKAALEHRTGARVPPDARILCWLVEFAAYLMNRCDIGSDGKTPLQRLHGRRDNTPILECGEKILYMPAKPARGGKWEPRFHPGVSVGMLNSSSEAVVVTEQGLAINTRSANIRRVPESERWDAGRILEMRATPWSPDGSDNAFDIQVEWRDPLRWCPEKQEKCWWKTR